MPYSNIDKPSKYFDTKLYTGTGSTQSVGGLSFKPDWTWIKTRNSGADWHRLIDAVRGVTKELYSNATNAESTQAQSLQTFNTDGFTLGTLAEVNANGNTFVSWNWLGANTTTSNTQGSITSTVSANTTSGFSIVSYTGNGTVGATVGHGLGVTPAMVIVKSRSTAQNWAVKILPFMTGGQRLELNSTGAISSEGAGAGSLWNATNPNSTVITLGDYAMTNTNGTTYIAYCWSQVKGFSKAFSYTGNGSTDGTFIYTGFSPAWVMIKQSSTSGNGWIMMDNKRNTYNPNGNYLQANLSDAEETAGPTVTDFLSNGFKIRTASGRVNTSGATYIGIAFASNPFVSSKGIPTCAF